MARICEDLDMAVRSSFYKKLYKGMARQHGKLPFRYASMFALAAHDTDAKEGECFLSLPFILMQTHMMMDLVSF